MRITQELANLSPLQRRRFMKLLGCALGGAAVPSALRFAFDDMAGGSGYAHAQTAERGTIFLEFNFRDQVDLMHVFVPPSLVNYPSLKRGVNGDETSLFYTPTDFTQASPTQFLTPDSLELMPHVGDIAMIDTGECGIGGVHGHEGGNGMRSPGRVMDGGSSGKQPMWLADGAHAAGSEELYTTTPTPATLHNYQQKQLDASLRNGFAFKGISRFKHSVYHFGAGLPNAELDRINSREALYSTFPAVATDASLLPNAQEAELLVGLLKNADQRLFQRRYAEAHGVSHLAELNASRQLLHVDNPKIVKVELTPDEETLWHTGIPNQQCTIGDAQAVDCSTDENAGGTDGSFVKAQVWEQFAFATKILISGATRSAAIEFDFMDLHGDGVRTDSVLRTQAQQAARPLARAISAFKAAGVWDRTLIAVYALDGSREPRANSYGDRGKGTVMLAGGMIKGGYYGDIKVTEDKSSGHTFGFQVPDATTGLPAGDPVTNWGDKGKRVPSSSVWLTVMKALGIPDELARQFPDVQDGKLLPYLLKA
ncbi:MAG TPA: hypothetical protein VIW29_16065 [Polyangiaceae bacterium]